MRIPIRTKLFLSLLLTVVVLMGGALWAVERTYSQQLEELKISRIQQGANTFDLFQWNNRNELWRVGLRFASSPRLWASIVEAGTGKDTRGDVQYEAEVEGIEADFLVVTDKDGNPIARFHSDLAPDRPAGSKIHWVDKLGPKGPGFPEAKLVDQLLNDGDPVKLSQNQFLQEAKDLFQVVVLPIFERDHFRGVLVLGLAINDAMARLIKRLQADDDGAGYISDQALMAASFTGARRAAVEEAIRTGKVSPGGAGGFTGVLAGEWDHLAVVTFGGPGSLHHVSGALLISLGSLMSFRDKIRTILFIVGIIAIGISLILALVISGNVSRPVHALVAGTVKIAEGDYSTRIVARTRDELGDLANAFNVMAEDLAAKEKARAVLHKVVSKDVAEELMRGDLGLGGRNQTVTLLFADLRGFTSMSSKMTPEAVVAMLNEYMTAMSRVILSSKGIVDKYVGDEVIGVFGAPRSYGTDALYAVQAAIQMQEAMAQLNDRRKARGDAPLNMGIGLNTGEVVAGCMGSEELLSYTCIGSTVNLASRLCSVAKAGQILVSQHTVDAVGESIAFKRLDPILVKGITRPVMVHEVLGLPGQAGLPAAAPPAHEGSAPTPPQPPPPPPPADRAA